MRSGFPKAARGKQLGRLSQLSVKREKENEVEKSGDSSSAKTRLKILMTTNQRRRNLTSDFDFLDVNEVALQKTSLTC